MTRIIRTLRRPTHRLATRLRTSRPGSVLILVVALLVLMALIGTAWLSTAQSDRYSTRQNSYNTQVDLLIQSVIAIAESEIVQDVVGSNNQFRSPAGNGVGNFELYDDSVNDRFLGSRLPILDVDPAMAGNQIGWPYITEPSVVDRFESPFATQADHVTPVTTPLPYKFGANARANAVPNYIDLTTNGKTERLPAFNVPGGNIALAADADGDGIADSGLFRLPVGTLNGIDYFGAIKIIDHNSAVNANTAWQANGIDQTDPDLYAQQFFPANINLNAVLRGGPTLTAANQVIGLNTWRFNSDPADDQSVTAPVIDKTEVYANGTHRPDLEFDTIEEKFNKQLVQRLKNPGQNNAATPAQKFQAVGTDETTGLAYRFILRNPLASRTILEDPDYRLGNSLYTAVRTKPYDLNVSPTAISEWFAENFDFTNALGAPTPPASRALLTTRNPLSNAAPDRLHRKSYATGAPYQFGDYVRFNYGGVTRTYVCLVPNGPNATFNTTTGEVTSESPVSPTSVILPATPPDGDILSDLVWQPVSWNEHPTRASANTADFAELWMAFYSIMNEGGGTAADRAPTLVGYAPPMADTTIPRVRRQWRNPIRDPGYSGGLEGNPAGTYQLLPTEVMKLRAAIAAVNAIDLRDNDINVTSRRIMLKAWTGFPAPNEMINVDTTVYGYEPQPFITEVYVNNFPGPMGGGNVVTNPQGYVAVELYNPYPFAISLEGWTLGIIDRRRVEAVRPAPVPAAPSAAGTVEDPFDGLRIRGITGLNGFPGTFVIPATSRLVLENYEYRADGSQPADPNAAYRPVATQLDQQTDLSGSGFRYVPNLSEVLRDRSRNAANRQPGGELVLLRPRRSDGVRINYGSATTTIRHFNEVNATDPAATFDQRSASLADMVPVDSFDFTEFYVDPMNAADDFREWHYVREHADAGGNAWKFVYPGRWAPVNAALAADRQPWAPYSVRTATPTDADNYMYRQEGTQTSSWDNVTGSDISPWYGDTPTPPITLGEVSNQSSYTNNFPGIPLHTGGAGGPNKPTAAGPNKYPFGGFARNGDLLQVPFIGSYRMKALIGGTPDWEILEMNSITMDSISAHDADTDYPAADLEADSVFTAVLSNDAGEHIGRFFPIQFLARTEDLQQITAGPLVSYHWTKDLFDYIGVWSPQDDYLPDVSRGLVDPEFRTPADGGPTMSSNGGVPPAVKTFRGGAAGEDFDRNYVTASSMQATDTMLPVPIANAGGQANDGNEDKVGIQGLININTASWKVLSAVPFFGPTVAPPAPVDEFGFDETTGTTTTAANGRADNIDMAHAIVYFRDVNDPTTGAPHGPFKSLFELNLVPEFATGGGTLNLAVEQPKADGDLNPDGVANDYENRFLMLNRVSNLLTTRSDTFTVYVMVQGWRNVGTNNPELVVQRREAFFTDRNSLSQTQRKLDKIFFPTD